jgi:hypothetical protein
MVSGFQASLKMLQGAPAIHERLAGGNMADVDEEIYPFGADLAAFIGVVTKHVQTYVDIYYADDADVASDDEMEAFWQGSVTSHLPFAYIAHANPILSSHVRVKVRSCGVDWGLTRTFRRFHCIPPQSTSFYHLVLHSRYSSPHVHRSLLQYGCTSCE